MKKVVFLVLVVLLMSAGCNGGHLPDLWGKPVSAQTPEIEPLDLIPIADWGWIDSFTAEPPCPDTTTTEVILTAEVRKTTMWKLYKRPMAGNWELVESGQLQYDNDPTQLVWVISPPPSQTTVYGLVTTLFGNHIGHTKGVTVWVGCPQISLSANPDGHLGVAPSSLPVTSTLTLSGENTESWTLEPGGFFGDVPFPWPWGFGQSVDLSETTTYKLTASNPCCDEVAYVQVVVCPQCVDGPDGISFDATAPCIEAGGSVTWCWEVEGACHVTMDPDPGVGYPLDGHDCVTLSATTDTYYETYFENNCGTLVWGNWLYVAPPPEIVAFNTSVDTTNTLDGDPCSPGAVWELDWVVENDRPMGWVPACGDQPDWPPGLPVRVGLWCKDAYGNVFPEWGPDKVALQGFTTYTLPSNFDASGLECWFCVGTVNCASINATACEPMDCESMLSGVCPKGCECIPPAWCLELALEGCPPDAPLACDYGPDGEPTKICCRCPNNCWCLPEDEAEQSDLAKCSPNVPCSEPGEPNKRCYTCPDWCECKTETWAQGLGYTPVQCYPEPCGVSVPSDYSTRGVEQAPEAVEQQAPLPVTVKEYCYAVCPEGCACMTLDELGDAGCYTGTAVIYNKLCIPEQCGVDVHGDAMYCCPEQEEPPPPPAPPAGLVECPDVVDELPLVLAQVAAMEQQIGVAREYAGGLELEFEDKLLVSEIKWALTPVPEPVEFACPPSPIESCEQAAAELKRLEARAEELSRAMEEASHYAAFMLAVTDLQEEVLTLYTNYNTQSISNIEEGIVDVRDKVEELDDPELSDLVKDLEEEIRTWVGVARIDPEAMYQPQNISSKCAQLCAESAKRICTVLPTGIIITIPETLSMD